jgi:hypothetical protein
LTKGTHTITATVTDSTGYTTQLGINVTVAAAPSTNIAPTVTITAPTNGATVTAGVAITFTGSASDTEDGNLSSRLAWRSNIDGAIGTGATFTRALSAGSHTITAAVTDSGGLATARSIAVSSVAAPPPAQPSTGASLSVRAYKEKGNAKADLSWSGFTATTIDVYRNGTKITTTANDGAMTDAINAKGNGTYTYRVCAAGTTTCSNDAKAVF